MKRNYFQSIITLFTLAFVLFGATLAANAQAQFRKKLDFNGDGKADIARASYDITANNKLYFYIANSPNDQFSAVQWGKPTNFNNTSDVPALGDFDGDGKADYAITRAEFGVCAWHILSSTAGYRRVAFGAATNLCELTVPADYDGDGKDDVAVTRQSQFDATMTTYWIRSSDGQFGSRSIAYDRDGTDCRASLPGDYNGDGKADSVVRCRQLSNNQMYFHISNDASTTAPRINWGVFTGFNGDTYFYTGDVFVPGDYDGDNKTDLAVVRYNGTTGETGSGVFNWYIRRSSDGALMTRQYGGQFNPGTSTGYNDQPIAADFDGDGKADVAVQRQVGTDSYFYILNSSNGTTRGLKFGASLTEVRYDTALARFLTSGRGAN